MQQTNLVLDTRILKTMMCSTCFIADFPNAHCFFQVTILTNSSEGY